MESTDNKTPTGISDHLVNDKIDQIAASSNAQDQALLEALKKFIIPLREAADRKSGDDVDQISVGSAGNLLIIALKDFISNAVRGQSEEKRVSEVSLIEHEIAIPASVGDVDMIDSDDRMDEENDNNNGKDKESASKDIVCNNPGTLRQWVPELAFEEKLLGALHECVYNRMPIRLLYFEPGAQGSSLRITLLERGAVYAHLKALLQAKLERHDPELHPQLMANIPFQLNICDTEMNEAIIGQLLHKFTGYAILSHTWLRAASEVTYSDWNNGTFDTTAPGYLKLVNFCKVAWRDHGVSFGWMDTVCINKDSSSELDESIRSMYNWYERADMCITYLATTETLSNMHLDPWFSRGWTLQELLAPDVIKFYNRDWNRLVKDATNDKDNAQIQDAIEWATTISQNELRYIRDAPISRRMQLAAKRQVTREEDASYSLMGIFNISMVTAYGEGAARAFSRLLQEILATTFKGVLDIFNWAGPNNYTTPHNSIVLPSHVENYNHRSTSASKVLRLLPTEPITLTHLGLRVPVILMPAMSALLLVSEYEPIGDYHATVDISPVKFWHSDLHTTYQLLDKNVSGADGKRIRDNRFQITFAVVNFTREMTNTICISKTCFAIALWCSEDVGKVSASSEVDTIGTDTPIVFNLNRKTTTGDIDTDKLGQYYRIKTDELPKHGMQLVTLYL